MSSNNTNNANGYDMIFKIVLIGDTSVGKTNILSKYLKGEFEPKSKSTVGVEFGVKNFKIENNIVKVQIWETAGEERYRSITNAYYKGAKGSLLIYDITNKKSFENIEKWISDLKANTGDNISMILLGNKTDLEEKREVSIEEGKNKAEFYNITFMETSAFNGNNIQEAFNELITDIYKKNHELLENQAKAEIIRDKNTIELFKGENTNTNEVKDRNWCC